MRIFPCDYHTEFCYTDNSRTSHTSGLYLLLDLVVSVIDHSNRLSSLPFPANRFDVIWSHEYRDHMCSDVSTWGPSHPDWRGWNICEIVLLECVNKFQVNARVVQERSNSVISIAIIRTGWPSSHATTPELTCYSSHKTELSVQNGCLLWRNCAIVPPKDYETVLVKFCMRHILVSQKLKHSQECMCGGQE